MTIFLKVFNFLCKHGHWTVTGRVFVGLLNLLLSVVLTKLMSASDYGNYQYYISIFLILEFCSNPGASNAVVKYVALGKDWSCNFLLNQRIKFSFVAIIIFAILGFYNIYVGDYSESIIYFSFSILFPFYFSYNLFIYYLHAKIELKRLNITLIIRSLTQLFFTILVFKLSNNVLITSISFVASESMLNWVFYKKNVKIFPTSNHETNVKKDAQKMAIGLSLVGILGTVVAQIDKILIFNLIDAKSLAIFSVGMMIGISVNSLFKSILSSLDAKLVVHDIKKWHYWFIFIFGSIVGGIISLIIPFIIATLYGEEYKESAYYASIVILSLGVYLVNHLLDASYMLHFKKNIVPIYVSKVGVAIIQLTLILLLFLFGSSGKEILKYLPYVYVSKILIQIFLINFSNLRITNFRN